MTKLLFNACPKCWADPWGKTSGPMRLNGDNDLSCLICGKIVVLAERREYDSRAGKKRSYTKTRSGTDMDEPRTVVTRNVRGRNTSNNPSTMAR